MPNSRTLEQILALLRARQAELRQRGVLHAAVFGSVARGEEQAASDIDILVELDPAQRPTLLTYAGVIRVLAALAAPLGRSVDVAQRRRLRDHVRPAAERDAIAAF